jgi:hypothetical protein
MLFIIVEITRLASEDYPGNVFWWMLLDSPIFS